MAVNIEPTWYEIYYLVYPHLRRDRTFSDRDIIRFFENNLTYEEQEKVKDYFMQFCPDEPPQVEPIPIPIPTPEVPVLPPVYVPSLEPVPTPQLPGGGDIPKLPPPVNIPTLLPTFPVIIPGIDPYILDLLEEWIGVAEAEAAEVIIPEEKEKPHLRLGEESKPLTPFSFTFEWIPAETKVPQPDTQVFKIETVPQNEAIQKNDVVFPWMLPQNIENVTESYQQAIDNFERFWEKLSQPVDNVFSAFGDSIFSTQTDQIGTSEIDVNGTSPIAGDIRQPEVIWIDYGEGRKTKEELDDQYFAELEEYLEYLESLIEEEYNN